MIFWSEQDVSFRPLHSSPWLDALHQVDISFELLPLCLQGDGQATPEDHTDLVHMIFIVGVSLTMFSSSWLLHSGLLWHLLTIKKSLALLQIVTYGVMDFAPLLSISRSMERSFLFLFGGLLLAVPVIAVISMICCVDLPVFLLLLLLGPLVM
jgi:hypothetical protein